jgi:hypothetical protein
LENQELRGRLDAISEGNILANLKQENRAIWMRLKEVEENARKDARDENNKVNNEWLIYACHKKWVCQKFWLLQIPNEKTKM